MKMKKIAAIAAATMMSISLASCGKSTDITVITRESGSGTRGAFVELTGVEEKDADGNKQDLTTDEAVTVNSTSIVMTQVAENEMAIGYISLGSLNDTVKALHVDGVEATVDNINNGSYTLARPFNIAYQSDLSDAAQDFVNYIFSDEGQAIVEENKYISVESTGTFSSTGAAEKIIIVGSSSVTPVMEKLIEGYEKINTAADIQLQESDSSSGMKAAIEGTADIGMASRELKESELATLTPLVIAMDGIAVVVNNDNEIDNISIENIKKIYKGEISSWDDVK